VFDAAAGVRGDAADAGRFAGVGSDRLGFTGAAGAGFTRSVSSATEGAAASGAGAVPEVADGVITASVSAAEGGTAAGGTDAASALTSGV
jgi:hypothetical protein